MTTQRVSVPPVVSEPRLVGARWVGGAWRAPRNPVPTARPLAGRGLTGGSSAATTPMEEQQG